MPRPYRRLALLALVRLAFSMHALPAADSAAAPSREWRANDGAWCAYDGDFYSYANATGQGLKIWIPPGGRPVRGIILFGNPGGGFGGDTRDKTRQRDLLEFAAWHDFAVGGVNGFPGRETDSVGRHVFAAVEAWAKEGSHPELARAPFIFSGSSNAGMFSVAMLGLAPERTLAITPNVGPHYRAAFGAAHREVPAWMHVGLTDPFFPGGVEFTEKLFDEQLPQGARWAWEAEVKGHQNGSSDHVDLAFWDAVIPLRLPAETGAPLRSIPLESGWWADLRSWDHQITRVGPAAEPKPRADDPTRYAWLPTEGIARLYQATATRARNLILSVANAERVAGGETTGIYLSSGGGYIASPGDRVTLHVDYAPLQRPPSSIEVLDQEKLLGSFDPEKTSEFTFTVPTGRPVLALHLLARQKRWDEIEYLRVSNPVQIVVRHPERSPLIAAQLEANSFPRRLPLADPEPPPAAAAPPDPAETLGARRLSAAEIAAARADGAISAFWNGPDAPVAVSYPVLGDQATAQAAWTDAGLLLRFRIRETATGEAPVGSGRIDFHVARTRLDAVRTRTDDLSVYTAPKRHFILRGAMQYSFPLPGSFAEAPAVSVNRWEPWDCVSTELSPRDGYSGTGVWIDRADEGHGVRSAELFIPWSLVGNPGFTRAPAPGTSLATVLGYSTAEKPARRVIWPHNQNPWSDKAEAPVYGQVLLLP